MAIRDPIVKHSDLKFNINLMKIWETIKDFSPAILKTPLVLLNLILTYVNKLIIIGLFIVLVGQTVHVLNGTERRYINLRHLLIKWINLIIIIILAGYVKKHTSYDEMFEFMCNMFAVAMVYPSKFIKNLHMKYFSYSQRKKYEETTEDISELDMSLFTRMLSSLTIFFLNVCRFMITFIAPVHRKKIEEAMRGVNLVIVEEKYFWKMYETSAKGSIVIPSAGKQTVPTFQSAGNLARSAIQTQKTNNEQKEIPKSPRSVQSLKQNTIRAKVSEYIEIPISSMNSIADKKFTFYRNIEIIYLCETGQLTIINQEDGKMTTHSLNQFNEENNLILKFGFVNEEDHPIFVKFKSKKEYDLFYNTLYLEAQPAGPQDSR